MRILMCAHWWVNAHAAGAEVMVQAMLTPLVERGHDVHVLLSREHPDIPDDYVVDGVQVHPHRSKFEMWEQVRYADVVLSHLENVDRARLVAHQSHTPHIPILHNDHPASRRGLDNWCRFGVVNSEWMADAVRGDAYCKLLVVRPPVVAARYATTPGSHVTLVNLNEAKGASIFYTLAERFPRMSFLGVTGSYGAQDVRRGLPNVEILDNVPPGRMRDLVYARTRVLLMPSTYESWGRVGVEAMASGIPVMAAPTPGLRESLGDAGIFAKRDHLDGWASLLRGLVDPRTYAVASARARERSEQLDPTDDLRRWTEAVEGL